MGGGKGYLPRINLHTLSPPGGLSRDELLYNKLSTECCPRGSKTLCEGPNFENELAN